MKKPVLALALIIPLWMNAQVSAYTPSTSIDNGGVTYFLPQTRIEVTIDLEKETYVPGEFSEYAKSELGITNKGKIATDTWRITNCTVKSAGIPDPEKAFFIKYKAKSAAPLLTLTQDGIIRGINIDLPPIEEETFTPSTKSNKAKAVESYMTQEMLMASSTSRKAKLFAREIFDIRESRNLLLRGEAETMPGDNESLKLVLSKLDEQEKAFLATFIGETTIETKQVKLSINPETCKGKTIICRFSKRFGLVDADDLSGEPVYIELENLNTVPVDPSATAINNKNAKVEGVVYNVPGKAAVKISMAGVKLAQATLLVTQFGNTEVLGNVLFSKSSAISVEFDPNSGALLHVEQ